MKHQNNGCCPECTNVFDRFEGFHAGLGLWFTNLQKNHPEAHISEAGRGRYLQNLLYDRHASNARWGESAHNYNAALDIFRMLKGETDYAKKWFEEVVQPALEPWLYWYGEPGCPFRERPHVQVRDWKKMVASGLLVLVERDE